jgi:hypothetical protein
MIKFEHDGLYVSCWKACWRGYDGVKALKWNPKVKPFVDQWVVEKDENLHELEVIKYHKPPLGFAKKGKCCRLVLKLKK